MDEVMGWEKIGRNGCGMVKSELKVVGRFDEMMVGENIKGVRVFVINER